MRAALVCGLLSLVACTNPADEHLCASAVTIAAEYGNTGVIRVLLTRGADLQNDHGNTALMYAAEYGHPSVMTLLLAARADVTLRDRDGETALMIAQRRGDAITVQLLKSAGAEE